MPSKRTGMRGTTRRALAPSRFGCGRFFFVTQAIASRPGTYRELSQGRFMKITERSKERGGFSHATGTPQGGFSQA
jgi:hypothetical protein